MNEEYSKEACEERHKHITMMLEKIDKSIDTLFSRLNWFYVTAIVMIVASSSSLVMTLLKK